MYLLQNGLLAKAFSILKEAHVRNAALLTLAVQIESNELQRDAINCTA